MNTLSSTTFHHYFKHGSDGCTLLLLHGTGGNEQSLLSLGTDLAPGAALLSPRGRVLEHGHPRFFRRLAEGVFDEVDLIYRTHELADFVTASAQQYSFDSQKVYALGYSNGANIAGALLLLRPGVLAGAALLRPMVPLQPAVLPDLQQAPVLIMSGHHDPIVPVENARRLAQMMNDANADVTMRLENAGHELSSYTVETIRRWLAGLTA